jgi:LysM repeat protein
MIMQRDMKVGLAVGLALIGVVGALFFRREPVNRDRDTPPPMKDTREIDRLIGEKGKTPYMEGIEDSPDQAAPVPPPQSPTPKSKSKTVSDDSPKFGTNDDPRDRERSRKSAPAPVPVKPLNDDVLTGDSAYPHNRDWEPAVPAVKKAVEPSRGGSGESSSPPRTHVVQAGETLSGLAARYLGSSARYREIYDANRDVLRTPDDLRDGVTIVIPDAPKPRDQRTAGSSGGAASSGNPGVKAQPASARSGETKNNDSPATAPRGDVPSEKIRFAPVKGGPFSAGRVAPAPGPSKSDSRKAADSEANQ